MIVIDQLIYLTLHLCAVASESIFSYKATTVVNGKAKEDEEEEEEEQTLTKRKRKEQESPRPVGLALKGKDEGEAAAAAATEEKKEPAPFASLPSFGMPSTSASSAPSTSFFAMGASSAPAAESASAGSVDFGGFAMPAKDSKKDEAAAPKTDFSGFSFGKTEGTSVLSDTFSSFIAPHPSTAAAVESAPAAVSFGGFSVPVAAKKDVRTPLLLLRSALLGRPALIWLIYTAVVNKRCSRSTRAGSAPAAPSRTPSRRPAAVSAWCPGLRPRLPPPLRKRPKRRKKRYSRHPQNNPSCEVLCSRLTLVFFLYPKRPAGAGHFVRFLLAGER